jgi:hypothetical protein
MGRADAARLSLRDGAASHAKILKDANMGLTP